VNFGGLSPALYWVRYFLSGQPIPFNGLDVQLDSVALAGWAGLLVTALNLVPVGTLDGGHVAYGLFGEKARRIFPIAMGVLIGLIFLPGLLTFSFGSFNFSWLLWAFILFWLGTSAPSRSTTSPNSIRPAAPSGTPCWSCSSCSSPRSPWWRIKIMSLRGAARADIVPFGERSPKGAVEAAATKQSPTWRLEIASQ
jgi:hypothetical protein